MMVLQAIKRWVVGEPVLSDAFTEAQALHEEAVAQQKAYWRGFSDGRTQATTAFLLTGHTSGRLHD